MADRTGLKNWINAGQRLRFEQAAYFADQKDDQRPAPTPFQYLRIHDEIAQNSFPWHAYDLERHGETATIPPDAAQPSSFSATMQ